MDDTTLIAQIETLLNVQAADDRFSGALLLARGPEVLLASARGWAVHPQLVPNHIETRFNLASVTKMLTAVAVVQLAAAGRLDLHAPIAACDPSLPHAAIVTPHHLLTHTAGFDYYWNDAYRAARSDLRSIDAYLALFADVPLLFAPGERHHYCNAGYVVLGALIERITGETFYNHLRRAVFEPAGMTETAFDELDLPDARRAVGYTTQAWHSPDDGQRRSNEFIYAVKGSPSEHCYSTVHDLHRFFQALQAHTLLDEAYTELCLAPHASSEQPGVRYGYGFHILDGRHGRVVGHGGRAMGGDAFALWYRDLGYTLVVLSNYDRPAARRVMDAVADLLVS